MKLDAITDGELAIMRAIWAQGEPTSRDIAVVLYDDVTDSKIASVQKLLERLEAKSYISRDRGARAHRFSALVSHETYLQNQLDAVADRLCDGAIVPLVTTLLGSKKLTRKNRDDLQDLIDQLWPPKK